MSWGVDETRLLQEKLGHSVDSYATAVDAVSYLLLFDREKRGDAFATLGFSPKIRDVLAVAKCNAEQSLYDFVRVEHFCEVCKRFDAYVKIDMFCMGLGARISLVDGVETDLAFGPTCVRPPVFGSSAMPLDGPVQCGASCSDVDGVDKHMLYVGDDVVITADIPDIPESVKNRVVEALFATTTQGGLRHDCRAQYRGNACGTGDYQCYAVRFQDSADGFDGPEFGFIGDQVSGGEMRLTGGVSLMEPVCRALDKPRFVSYNARVREVHLTELCDGTRVDRVYKISSDVDAWLMSRGSRQSLPVSVVFDSAVAGGYLFIKEIADIVVEIGVMTKGN